MRSVIISAAVLIVLIVAIAFSSVYVERACEQMALALDQLYDAALNGSWGEAAVKTGRIEAQWDQHSQILTILFDHKELDAISSSIEKIEQYVAFENREKSAAEIANASMLVRALPRKDVLTISNIL